MDFGLARILGPDCLTNEPFGTVGYCAPEILTLGLTVISNSLLLYFIPGRYIPRKVNILILAARIRQVACNQLGNVILLFATGNQIIFDDEQQ